MSNEERPRILNEMQSKKSELESQIKKMEKYIYENETKYPGEVIKVRSFKVQGVARHVIKAL